MVRTTSYSRLDTLLDEVAGKNHATRNSKALVSNNVINENEVPSPVKTYEFEWPLYKKEEKEQGLWETNASSTKTKMSQDSKEGRRSTWLTRMNHRTKAVGTHEGAQAIPKEEPPSRPLSQRLSLRGIIGTLTSPIKVYSDKIDETSPGSKCRNRESTPFNESRKKNSTKFSEACELDYSDNRRDKEHGLFSNIQEIKVARFSDEFEFSPSGFYDNGSNIGSADNVQSLSTRDSEEEAVVPTCDNPSERAPMALPLKRKSMEGTGSQNPYDYVFDPPDKTSEHEVAFSYVNEEETELKHNLVQLWRLIHQDDSGDISDSEFQSSALVLSRELLENAQSKVDSQRFAIDELTQRVLELQTMVDKAPKTNCKLARLQRKLDANTIVMEKWKLEKQFSQKKIEYLEHTVDTFKAQEKAATEASMNTKRASKRTQEATDTRIAELAHKVDVLAYYKDVSLQYLWELEGKLANLLPPSMIKTFHERADTLRTKLALRNISSLNCQDQVQKMKGLISDFYSDGVDSNIMSGILVNWPQVIRSNNFLTQKLVELRVQINENKAAQSTNDRAKGEFNRRRHPNNRTKISQEFLQPFSTYDAACYY